MHRNIEDRSLDRNSYEYEGGDDQIHITINNIPDEHKEDANQNQEEQEINNQSELSNEENESDEYKSVKCHTIFENWYHDLKPKYSRFFPTVKVLQRYVFTLLIISLRQNGISEAAIFILAPQIVYITYIILARPFRNIIDYVIEVSFEVIFGIFLVLAIIHQNTKVDCKWETWFPTTILFLCIGK